MPFGVEHFLSPRTFVGGLCLDIPLMPFGVEQAQGLSLGPVFGVPGHTFDAFWR